MAVRAFAAEDGNLQVKSVVVAKEKTYRDIDLSFARRPSGDIYKKTDAAAVKQAVKNILLTNRFEKPFLPDFGGDLNDFIFNLDTEFDADEIREHIVKSINFYESRVQVLSVKTDIQSNYNTVAVSITFKILSSSEQFSVNLNLTRLR